MRTTLLAVALLLTSQAAQADYDGSSFGDEGVIVLLQQYDSIDFLDPRNRNRIFTPGNQLAIIRETFQTSAVTHLDRIQKPARTKLSQRSTFA